MPGLLESVNMDLLCYVVLLIMPVLGCMSNQDRAVRLMAAQCFASLVTFMPLEVCSLTLGHAVNVCSCTLIMLHL